MHPQRRDLSLPGVRKAKPMRNMLAGGLALLTVSLATHGETLDTSASPGKRLAVTADCVACHSTRDGKPLPAVTRSTRRWASSTRQTSPPP